MGSCSKPILKGRQLIRQLSALLNHISLLLKELAVCMACVFKKLKTITGILEFWNIFAIFFAVLHAPAHHRHSPAVVSAIKSRWLVANLFWNTTVLLSRRGLNYMVLQAGK